MADRPTTTGTTEPREFLMPYPIAVHLPDSDCTYPGYLYLPGQPVTVGSETTCDYCGEQMSTRGTLDAATGAQVPQTPRTGDHDGVVSGFYSPIPGGRPMEASYGHLRCVLESITDTGVVEWVTLGSFDPESREFPLLDTPGRHAVSA